MYVNIYKLCICFIILVIYLIYTLIYTTHEIYIHILCVGNIFAVMAESKNVEGVSYYLLRCTMEREKLTKTEISDEIIFPTG